VQLASVFEHRVRPRFPGCTPHVNPADKHLRGTAAFEPQAYPAGWPPWGVKPRIDRLRSSFTSKRRNGAPTGLTLAPESRRNPWVSGRFNLRDPFVVPPQKSFPYSDSNPRQAALPDLIRSLFGPIIFRCGLVLRSVHCDAINRRRIRVRSDRSASGPANGPARNRARAIPINVPPRQCPGGSCSGSACSVG